LWRPRTQPDHHPLRDRCVAVQRSVVQRNQRVRLRVVGGCAAMRSVVVDDAEVLGDPFDTVGLLPDKVDSLAVLESEGSDVVTVDEHHPAAVLHTPIPVAEPVDGGVELVVAAHRLQ